MTTIQARQQIALLLSARDKIEYALNHRLINRHIQTIRQMWGGKWNDDVAEEYISLLKTRIPASANPNQAS